MLTKDTFKKLVIAIRDNGEYTTRVIDDVEYRVYKVSELSLILSKFKNAWKPEGVSFTLFDVEFFVAPNGNITMTNETEDGEEIDSEVFSLTDEELLSVVSSFINWRLSVMSKLNI